MKNWYEKLVQFFPQKPLIFILRFHFILKVLLIYIYTYFHFHLINETSPKSFIFTFHFYN